MTSPRTKFIRALLLIFLSMAGMYAFPQPVQALDLDSVAIPYWSIPGTISEETQCDVSPTRTDIQNTSDCSLLFGFDMSDEIASTYFDTAQRVTQIFVTNGTQVVRHDIDSALNLTTTPLPMTPGLPWAAADLDLDGNLDLIVQRGDGANGFLDIHSAPSWALRSRTIFPGMNVYFSASVANIDDDPYLEVHALPTNLGLQGKVAVVQYDAEADTFVLTDYITPPPGTVGSSAISDFDGDGLVEIITGSDYEGHMLYEYNDGLSLIGPVGAIYYGMNRSATVARPKPDGIVYAVIGHSGSGSGYLYQILKPKTNNVFEVVRVFQEITGFAGAHPIVAYDSDCDGIDELLLKFYPIFRVWEWSEQSDSFVQGCNWDADVFGTFTSYLRVDLNQDGVPEWGTVNHNDRFQAFAEDFCATPDTGLVSWWPLDEVSGAVTTDVWGESDGAWVGNPVPVAGYVAGSLLLDGFDDYASVADTDSLDVGEGDLSFEAWISTTSSLPVNPLVSKYDNANDLGWALWIADGNSLQLSLAGGVTPPSFTGERADCGAGKDPRTTDFKAVGVRIDQSIIRRVGALGASIVGCASPHEPH